MFNFNPKERYTLNFFVSGLPCPVIVVTDSEASEACLNAKYASGFAGIDDLVSWCLANNYMCEILKFLH